MKKKELIITSVTVIISFLIIISAFRFFNFKDEGKKCYTMDQLKKEISSKIDASKELKKSSFCVEDKVNFVKEIKIPKPILEKKETFGYEVKFNLSKNIHLVAVGFESEKGKFTYFSSDKNVSFKREEKIKFELSVKKFKNILLPEENYWKTVEPFFYRQIIFRYVENIIFKEIEIADISKDFSVNNKTNSFHCNLTFNSISDFYPYPVKWKDVNLSMSENYLEKYFDDYFIKVYHEDTFLGRLESDDSDLDKFIEPGNRIEIAGSNYTGDSEYVSVQLETKRPSNIDHKLISPFPVTPRYDIYFEGGK